jgi:hypothetical protein
MKNRASKPPSQTFGRFQHLWMQKVSSNSKAGRASQASFRTLLFDVFPTVAQVYLANCLDDFEHKQDFQRSIPTK